MTLLVVAVLVVACGIAFFQGDAAPGTTPGGSLPPEARAPVAIPLADASITGIDVPRMGLSTQEVLSLGLRDDNSLDVPTNASTVGWYQRSSTPGTVGPAVMLAHVNYLGEQGAFAHLADMQAGDVVEVHRDDETTAVFAVDRVGQYAKDAFPTDAVYAPTDDSQLRLITCGGVFNPRTRSYEDNIVVFGHLTGAYRPV